MELKVTETYTDADGKEGVQSHLYGIESRDGGQQQQQRDGFNRTFMELKDGMETLLGALEAGFNRTFMELKATRLQQPYMAAIVSIAPLWN